MGTFNVSSISQERGAARLSNFSEDAFELDGQQFASVEGFIQGTKFCPGEPIREQAFAASGITAKRMGKGAPGKYIWWKGATINYGSPQHHQLIERAIRAKFDQNREVVGMLVATEGKILTHEVGGTADTALPAAVFCDILTRIRQEALARLALIVVTGSFNDREARMGPWTGYGKTIPEAIGELIRNHPEMFSIKLDIK